MPNCVFARIDLPMNGMLFLLLPLFPIHFLLLTIFLSFQMRRRISIRGCVCPSVVLLLLTTNITVTTTTATTQWLLGPPEQEKLLGDLPSTDPHQHLTTTIIYVSRVYRGMLKGFRGPREVFFPIEGHCGPSVRPQLFSDAY